MFKAVLTTGVLVIGLVSAASAAPIPKDPKVPKIPTPKGPPKVDPKTLKLLMTQIDISFQGTADKQADGSYIIAPKVTVTASTPSDGKHGIGEGTGISILRSDAVTCQDGSAVTSYTPAFPAFTQGAKQGSAFVVTASITSDQYSIGGKCASGQPDSATTTLTVSVPNKAGSTVTKTVVTHMNHFNF